MKVARKMKLTDRGPVDWPLMVTNVVGSPPDQLTVTPWERVTEVIEPMLVQVRGAGTTMLALKPPTSLPRRHC